MFNVIQKKRIDSKKKETIFLSLGVDWERKNMDKSIQVINDLNSLKIKSKIFIVGSQPPKKYKSPKYVKLIPFLNKNDINDKKILHNLFLKSHFFILLSKAEAYGLVINEATCYGLPIITNNIDGLKYVAKKNYSILNDINSKPSEIALKIDFLNNNMRKYKNFSNEDYLSTYINSWVNVTIEIKKTILEII